MLSFSNLSPSVLVDGVGRPREIRTAGQRLAVTGLESVRDETAAYPLGSGPRTVFLVQASGRRYRLVHLLRDRRWTVEEVAAGHMGLASAA